MFAREYSSTNKGFPTLFQSEPPGILNGHLTWEILGFLLEIGFSAGIFSFWVERWIDIVALEKMSVTFSLV